MDLRDLKMFLHLADSRHFGRSARAMHVSPSTLSRQIQRLEEHLNQPLFVRDNRTVTLTEAGEQLRQFAQQTMLQYQQMRHTLGQQGPSLSGELHLFCSVTAAYSHLPPILDRFRAEHPSVEIKLTTGDASDAVEKVDSNEADIAIAGKPETLPPGVAFSILEDLAVVLIAPALPCPVRTQVQQPVPDWTKVPFILPEQGPVRRRIELWFRSKKITNPFIYATVAGHEAMVSMVALGCGIALIPEIVLENSPEPVRNRVLIMDRNDENTPFELGVCAQKKRLNEPLISAFWKLLPGNH
ncbi:HTH-type transcriptional activator IlvY [Klebsiella sp. BIGb0407]|uniref:HTH-type transcriptional activator IlvY n=1 Tax=Klebsiella sp. BIGb0407 TaxID=2940603 RepID=UPI002169690C|nr:HTH-type transcriptional activator IlvY [Klebsiella sp. BIGb0407]MCS3434430.1 LysR family positive regulator for ilvC [Klebsiella sp. BIGb0407]